MGKVKLGMASEHYKYPHKVSIPDGKGKEQHFVHDSIIYTIYRFVKVKFEFFGMKFLFKLSQNYGLKAILSP